MINAYTHGRYVDINLLANEYESWDPTSLIVFNIPSTTFPVNFWGKRIRNEFRVRMPVFSEMTKDAIKKFYCVTEAIHKRDVGMPRILRFNY
jgi:hypothetical protein